MNPFVKATLSAGLVALGSAAAAAQGAPSVAPAGEKLKIGFIYVGPVGDHGWSYQHDQGRLAIERELGPRVETSFVESVPEADSERAIEQLARTGHKLVFTTSFGFMEPTLRVARRYPSVFFEHATGFKRSGNLATYSGKFHEGRYVSGQIAARVSKTGTLGHVGAFPIPEVVAGVNAYMLGAQSVRPDIKLKVVWVNSWYDPGKEADAAKALLDQGADIISQHTDSPAPLQQAEARGKQGFGQATDMIRFAPKAQLTAIVDDWSGYYVSRAKAVLDGTWKSGDMWGGLDRKVVVMAPYTNMPDEVKRAAMDTEEAIRAGSLNPFKCPVVAQDGKEVECKGAGALSDEQVLGMNFYVKGIDERLPK